jgi:nucleotide-binding universal stress UspA family protein
VCEAPSYLRKEELIVQIVVATAASTEKDHAMARAADIARIHNARVRVVPGEEGAGWHLGRAAREHATGLVVLQGRPRHLVDLLAGATPERIADSSDRPVLVVNRAVRRPYAQVLDCIDDRTDVRRALETTRFVAPRATVSFLHAYEGVYETALLLDGANARKLQQYLRDVRREACAGLSKKIENAGGDPALLLLRRGGAQHVILREERRRRANDTLFVLERRRSLIRHWIFGSVSQSLVRDGKSDVLIVRAARGT